mmetsp:Transcript_13567/g.23094  ORF Transcript_13567/g.23094 Transcript_13567/m.23094 type:complete len:245 (-) Transcript_13567:717-1451(-)
MIKGKVNFVFTNGQILIHGCGQELFPLYLVCSGQTQILTQIFQVFHDLYWKILAFQRISEVLQRHGTITILINTPKDVFQGTNFLLGKTGGDICKRGFFELLHSHVPFERSSTSTSMRDAGPSCRGNLGAKLTCNPLMLHRLSCCQSFGGVHFQKETNKLFRVLADIVPLGARKVVPSHPNRFEDFIVGIAVEGRIATQENVCDNPNRPDITTLGVFSPQDLWCHIVGSSDFSFHNVGRRVVSR